MNIVHAILDRVGNLPYSLLAVMITDGRNPGACKLPVNLLSAVLCYTGWGGRDFRSIRPLWGKGTLKKNFETP